MKCWHFLTLKCVGKATKKICWCLNIALSAEFPRHCPKMPVTWAFVLAPMTNFNPFIFVIMNGPLAHFIVSLCPAHGPHLHHIVGLFHLPQIVRLCHIDINSSRHITQPAMKMSAMLAFQAFIIWWTYQNLLTSINIRNRMIVLNQCINMNAQKFYGHVSASWLWGLDASM